MIEAQNDRLPVHDMRRAARVQMLEIRRARIALRKASDRSVESAVFFGPALPDVKDQAAATVEDDMPFNHAPETADELQVEEMTEKPVADTAIVQLSEGPVAAAPEQISPQSSAAVPEAPQILCDLDQLPGAGPGLIWMLNECGVKTLADLTQVDGPELSLKLGVVGQILDVERLIEFAKRT